MSSDLASLYIRVDSKGVVTASKNLDDFTGKAQKVEGATKKVETATQSAGAKFAAMAGTVMKLTAAFAALAAVQRGWGLMAEAAKYEQQVRALNNLAASYNSNGNKIIADLKRISDGTINTITLVEKAGTAMMLGIAPEKISKLMEIARATARMTGQEVSTAFDNIAMAVGRQSKMILDNLGIIVSVESANRTYAVQLKKTADNLSDTEKKAAFLNATIAAGEDLIARMGQQSDTTKDKMDRLKASVDNARLMIGQGLIRVVLGATGAFQWLAAGVMTVIAIIPKLLEYMARANAKIYEWTGQTERMKASLSEAASLKKGYEDMLGAAGELAGKAADNFSAMVSSTEDMAGATNRAIPPIDGVTDTLDAAATAAQKLREEWIKLKAELDFEKAAAGMDDLDKKLAEIERDMEKMRSNPNADLKLIDEIELQRQTAAIKAWYDEYIQEQIKAKENFDRYEKAKQDLISKGAQETADAIKKQYDADGQLLRDKLELYKDLEGFEDEYRQVQLEWIERLKNENIKATGEVLAAEEKAAKERKRIEYDLFKTKTDYISTGFGQLQSAFTAIAATYDEGSAAANRWKEAAKGMEIAQKAVAVVQAVAAIATQGLGDPYTAFARIAAMAATMGALLASIGTSIGGSGGGAITSAPQSKFSSSVLGGEEGELSESLKKSWEFLEDTYDMEYEKLTKIHNELKDLNDNITGLVTSIIRTGSVGAGFTLPSGGPGSAESLVNKLSESGIMSLFMGGSNFSGSIASTINTVRAIGLDFGSLIVEKFVPGLLGSLVSGIFGGGTEYWSGASGIGVYGGQAGAFKQGAGTGGYTWQDMHSKKDGGWFSSDEYSSWRETAGLDASVVDLFSKVYQNLSDTLVELTIGLGQDVTKTLAYVFPGGTLALNGLSAEQISETLTNYFSAQADAAVQTLFGSLLKGYQEVGESLMDTAVRLMVDKEIVLEVLAQTNQAYSGSTANAIALSEALIKLAGDLETLTDIASTYYDKFFTEEEKHLRLQEQLTTILGALNIALPETRQAYRDIVESLDLTTTSGQTAYITLLKLADGADTYYSTLEDMADELTETAKALQAAFSTTNDAISEQISLAGAAASAARSAANEYRNIIKSLTDAQESIRGGSTAEMQQRFESLFASAMTGDREALSALPGAADKLLAGSLASSRTALDYARDQGKMLLALEEAKTVSGVSANWQDYQATLLETQVNVLEQIRDELQQESPDLALLEQHAGLLEDIATLLGGQTSEIITGNATQDVIANLSSLNTSYSEEMLNALISGESAQTSSLEGILTATTTTVGLIRQLVDLSTANEKEKFMAKITAMQSTLDTVTGSVLTAQTTLYQRQAEIEPTRQEVSYAALAQAKAESEAARQVYQNIVAGESQHFDYFYWTPEDYSSGVQFQGHGYQTNNWEVYGRHQAAWAAYTKEFKEARALMNYSAPDTDPTVSAAIQRKNAAENQLNIARGSLLDAQDDLNLLIEQYEDMFGERPPGYASGGSFSGGLRLVGEQGPELEFTGPSRIYSNSDSKKLLNIDELVAEVKALRAEVKAGNYQIIKHTQKTAKTLEKFDYDGLPDTRVA